MNKNLKSITLMQGYTILFSLETFQTNIFKIYTTQGLGYCLMEKVRKVSQKDEKQSFADVLQNRCY